MVKSHLVQILRTFSKKELRELRKWLQSPAHNQREDVVRLLEYLVEDDHLYKDAFLDKKSVFRWIHPKETFDDAKIRQTIFFFMKALESFLIYDEIRQDEIYTKTALARVFRKRRLDRTFQKNLKQIQSLQEKHAFRNSRFLRNQYLAQQEEYTFIVSQNRTIPMNLQEVSNSLDVTYLADKLRQTCHMQAHQTVYKAEYETGLLKEVLQYVENNKFLNVPAIAIYYYIYKAITEKEEEAHFQHLKREVMEYGHLFPPSEIRDIYLLAINYCIGRMNAGDGAFTREAFELYRRGFDENILIENEAMSRWTFQNVALIGLKLQEYDWVERFIKNFQQYLEDKHRDSVVAYSLARMYYEKGNYDDAMQQINAADYDDILINLNAKTLLFKMFYEQEELDALESLLESMRNYLVRKKVIGYHKSNYKNIIRYTKKLLKLNPYNNGQKEKLRKEIESAAPLTEKEWLLRQVERV